MVKAAIRSQRSRGWVFTYNIPNKETWPDEKSHWVEELTCIWEEKKERPTDRRSWGENSNIREQAEVMAGNYFKGKWEDILEHPKMEAKPEYMIFQRELAPTTLQKHYQGYMYFKNQVVFDSVKAVLNFWGFDNAHIEAARGTCRQNYEYCTKLDSRDPEWKRHRTEGVTEFGRKPVQGKRVDLEDVMDAIEQGHECSDEMQATGSSRPAYSLLVVRTNWGGEVTEGFRRLSRCLRKDEFDVVGWIRGTGHGDHRRLSTEPMHLPGAPPDFGSLPDESTNERIFCRTVGHKVCNFNYAKAGGYLAWKDGRGNEPVVTEDHPHSGIPIVTRKRTFSDDINPEESGAPLPSVIRRHHSGEISSFVYDHFKYQESIYYLDGLGRRHNACRLQIQRLVDMAKEDCRIYKYPLGEDRFKMDQGNWYSDAMKRLWKRYGYTENTLYFEKAMDQQVYHAIREMQIEDIDQDEKNASLYM